MVVGKIKVFIFLLIYLQSKRISENLNCFRKGMLFRDVIPTLVNKCVVDWVVKVIAALYSGYWCVHKKRQKGGT